MKRFTLTALGFVVGGLVLGLLTHLALVAAVALLGGLLWACASLKAKNDELQAEAREMADSPP